MVEFPAVVPDDGSGILLPGEAAHVPALLVLRRPVAHRNFLAQLSWLKRISCGFILGNITVGLGIMRYARGNALCTLEAKLLRTSVHTRMYVLSSLNER